MFTRIVGVSPKVFLDHHRLTRLRGLLRRGESVSRASYAVGYGSIRAVYEKTGKGLGMTPAIYRAGAAGETVHYSIASVPWGRVVVAGTERGICMVRVSRQGETLAADVGLEFSRAILVRESRMPVLWTAALKTCQVEDPLLTEAGGRRSDGRLPSEDVERARPCPPSVSQYDVATSERFVTERT
jgi:AraC family transcriptional regulator of adaptative response/methylated-DNA-[protein]-cysteine methyltransferase